MDGRVALLTSYRWDEEHMHLLELEDGVGFAPSRRLTTESTGQLQRQAGFFHDEQRTGYLVAAGVFSESCHEIMIMSCLTDTTPYILYQKETLPTTMYLVTCTEVPLVRQVRVTLTGTAEHRCPSLLRFVR